MVARWKRRAAIASAQAKIDEERGTEALRGWRAVASDSRPGEVTYEHIETGTRTSEVPTLENQDWIVGFWASDELLRLRLLFNAGAALGCVLQISRKAGSPCPVMSDQES